MRVDALILRAEKLTLVPWRTSFDFNAAEMHVERKKRGRSPRHPIRGDELRALRRLHKEQDPKCRRPTIPRNLLPA
jgi:hypothetical protein